MTESDLVAHALRELSLSGMFDPDSDYAGDIAPKVLELVWLFAEQGHSGGSAFITMEMLTRLLRYEPLTPLTDNPEEWMDVDGEGLWQNRRMPSAFSNDRGETYYDLNEEMINGEQPIHKSEEHDG